MLTNKQQFGGAGWNLYARPPTLDRATQKVFWAGD